ncbi:MAG TPA: hypothetical protein VL133_16245 [Devosia sp.]|nr:hypothetical protein [Devosia sp.]
MTLATIVTFWHGPISWLEKLCAASFVRQGHKVDIYAFQPIAGLPEGVTWRDAAEFLPREKLVLYKGRGTPAVFSDQFRVLLLRAGRGIWADLDVYCLKPFADPPAYLMGWEREGSVNSAVLLVPADSELLARLSAVFDAGPRPLLEPHLPLGRRLEVAARRLLGQKVAPEYMQYGATGPFALTHFVWELGLNGQVQKREVFYPVRYEQVPLLMQAGSRLEQFVTQQTLAVHIWRSQITNRGRAEMPAPAKDSALAVACAAMGVAV